MISGKEGQIEVQGIDGIEKMGMKVNGKSFSLMIDKLYVHKEDAVVREIASNCRDAHVSAGKADLPFEIYLPSDISHELIFKDHGIGLSKEDVFKYLGTLFESSKDNENVSIGSYGLGSKSPFCVTDSYIIESIKDKQKHHFSFFWAKGGTPQLVWVSSEETEESNGITFRIPCPPARYQKYLESIRSQLCLFNPRPKVFNLGTEIDPWANFKLVDREGLDFMRVEDDKFFARYGVFAANMGGVIYPIDVAMCNINIEDLQEDGIIPYFKDISVEESIKIKESIAELNRFKDKLNNRYKLNTSGFTKVFAFNIGDLEVPPSREFIEYDARTSYNVLREITKRIVEAEKRVVNNYKDAVESVQGKKPEEIIEEFTNKVDIGSIYAGSYERKVDPLYETLRDNDPVVFTKLNEPTGMPYPVKHTSSYGDMVISNYDGLIEMPITKILIGHGEIPMPLIKKRTEKNLSIEFTREELIFDDAGNPVELGEFGLIELYHQAGRQSDMFLHDDLSCLERHYSIEEDPLAIVKSSGKVYQAGNSLVKRRAVTSMLEGVKKFKRVYEDALSKHGFILQKDSSDFDLAGIEVMTDSLVITPTINELNPLREPTLGYSRFSNGVEKKIGDGLFETVVQSSLVRRNKEIINKIFDGAVYAIQADYENNPRPKNPWGSELSAVVLTALRAINVKGEGWRIVDGIATLDHYVVNVKTTSNNVAPKYHMTGNLISYYAKTISPSDIGNYKEIFHLPYNETRLPSSIQLPAKLEDMRSRASRNSGNSKHLIIVKDCEGTNLSKRLTWLAKSIAHFGAKYSLASVPTLDALYAYAANNQEEVKSKEIYRFDFQINLVTSEDGDFSSFYEMEKLSPGNYKVFKLSDLKDPPVPPKKKTELAVRGVRKLEVTPTLSRSRYNEGALLQVKEATIEDIEPGFYVYGVSDNEKIYFDKEMKHEIDKEELQALLGAAAYSWRKLNELRLTKHFRNQRRGPDGLLTKKLEEMGKMKERNYLGRVYRISPVMFSKEEKLKEYGWIPLIEQFNRVQPASCWKGLPKKVSRQYNRLMNRLAFAEAAAHLKNTEGSNEQLMQVMDDAYQINHRRPKMVELIARAKKDRKNRYNIDSWYVDLYDNFISQFSAHYGSMDLDTVFALARDFHNLVSDHRIDASLNRGKLSPVRHRIIGTRHSIIRIFKELIKKDPQAFVINASKEMRSGELYDHSVNELKALLLTKKQA